MNEDKDRCRACGGKCCQYAPGAYHVEDSVPNDAVLDCVIVVNGDSQRKILFPRAAVKGKEGIKNDAFNNGVCTHLSPEGCDLPSYDRPMECKHLIPMEPESRCKAQHHDRISCALSWAGRQEYLKARFL